MLCANHVLLRYVTSQPDYKGEQVDLHKFTNLPPLVYDLFYKLSTSLHTMESWTSSLSLNISNTQSTTLDSWMLSRNLFPNQACSNLLLQFSPPQHSRIPSCLLRLHNGNTSAGTTATKNVCRNTPPKHGPISSGNHKVSRAYG